MDAPGGNGRADAEADGHNYFARGFSLGGRTRPPADSGAESGPEPLTLAPLSDDAEPAISKAEVAELGLPVRVRQASLAPQLRSTPAATAAEGPATAGAVAGSGPAETKSAPAEASGTGSPAPPTPEAARNTVSALQRGWQLGRSEGETAADPSISVFKPRKSPSGQPFDPFDAESGSADVDPAGSADENSDE
jgi:hypothetical protein